MAIQIANSAADESVAKEVSQYSGAAADDMDRIADGLGLRGNAIRFLATEIKNLSDRAMKFATM